MTLRLSHIH